MFLAYLRAILQVVTRLILVLTIVSMLAFSVLVWLDRPYQPPRWEIEP